MTIVEADEIVLDAEVDDVRIVLTPAPPPPPPRPPTPVAGFGDDEFAAAAPGGRVLAFLREPVARCHFDRLLLVDGAQRIERPLPAWVYYERHLALGKKLLLGGCRQAWIVDWRDGAMTEIFDEPDADGIQVCWLDDDAAVAAGFRELAIVGPRGRVTLPCRHAVGAHVAGADLLVVSDDDGAQWIKGGRVVARDWRTIVHSHNNVVVGAGGDAFFVSVR
jgi:hypothetical protein